MMCDSCDFKKCFVCSDPNMFIFGAECLYGCKTGYLCDNLVTLAMDLTIIIVLKLL